MANRSVDNAVRHLRRAALQGGAGLTDGQLLECFIASRDEAAFEALVRRHGPMVLGVCRRVLRHDQDAEDAFQAAFLVLARKAATVTPRDLLANWLYGVACKTAAKARGLRAKRQTREKHVTVMPDPAAVQHDNSAAALPPLLDQELSRLPAKYRVPVVLCDLEGKTRKVAAQQLGWPEGTVSSRLSRAREMLARRLSRHGLGTSAGSLAAVLAQEVASADIPAALVASTVKAAGGFAMGQTLAAGVVSAEVTILTERVLNSMFLNRVTTVAAVLLMAVALTGGTGAILSSVSGADPQQATAAEQPQPPKAEDGAVSWNEIARTYYQNVALAEEKYEGKKILVTGHMERIAQLHKGGKVSRYALQMSYSTTTSTASSRGRGGGGRTTGGGKTSETTSVRTTVLLLSFEFGSEAQKQLAGLDPSKLLTIEGWCDGISTDRTGGPEVVRFLNCRIVKVEEPGGGGN
jgi:RNA polymerase sigma factor (sigma-70 family)